MSISDPAEIFKMQLTCPTCCGKPESFFANGYVCPVCGRRESRFLKAIDAQLAMKDAWRYRELRRGQHWSVIDGIGNTLRADDLDAAIDAAMLKASNVEASGGPSAESRKSAMAVRR